jgi:hypothetical protein
MATPSLVEPALVWLRKGALDRSLAAGADPAASPELARRARQLTSPRFRAGLATSLRNVVETAERRPGAFTAAIPVRREQVRAQRRLILDLADDLESGDEIRPGGIVMVERLLEEGASPLYVEGALREFLVQVRAALHQA